MAKMLNTAAAAVSTDTSWKSDAFVNFYVRRDDGSRVKIGAFGLKESKKFESGLIKRLQQEGAVADLMKVLEVDFQMAESSTPANVGF